MEENVEKVFDQCSGNSRLYGDLIDDLLHLLRHPTKNEQRLSDRRVDFLSESESDAINSVNFLFFVDYSDKHDLQGSGDSSQQLR